MKTHLLLTALTSGLFFALPVTRAQVEEPKLDTPGVEVLARGPVHEAYAAPVDGQPEAGPVIPNAPPPPIEELPPEVKPQGDNVQWVPGYWQWDTDRNDYIWVSGVWRKPPPGRKWIPGHYSQADGGYRWVAGFWAPAEQRAMTYQPTPPPSVEEGPSAPAPSDDAFYNPGCWVYRDGRYLWQPGSYLDYQPDWVWNPARYLWTPAGCVFVDGYWDYPLATRGLLFAPVACDPDVCYQPGFVYRPSCAFPPPLLATALFCRPGWGHYFVGDYFGAAHRRAGFVSFLDYRYGRGGFRDPLYNYYHAAYAGRPWERDLRSLYAGRFAGTIPPPPRTLHQQNAFLRDVRENRTTVTGTNVRNLTLLSPLSQPSRLAVPVTSVPANQIAASRQTVSEVRGLAQQRRDLEARLLKTEGVPARTNDRPRVGTLNTPATVPGVIRRETPPVVRHEAPAPLKPAAPTVRNALVPPPVVRHEAVAPRRIASPAPVQRIPMVRSAPPPTVHRAAPPSRPALAAPARPAPRPAVRPAPTPRSNPPKAKPKK